MLKPSRAHTEPLHHSKSRFPLPRDKPKTERKTMTTFHVAKALYSPRPLTPSQRLVMILLADRATQDDEAHYTIEELAYLAGMTEDDLTAVLFALVHAGLLSRLEASPLKREGCEPTMTMSRLILD